MMYKGSKTIATFFGIAVCILIIAPNSYAKNPFSISNVSFSKDLSLHVIPNEFLKIDFNYTSNGNEVQVFAEPMYKGQLLKNAEIIPSAILKDTIGLTNCSFTLSGVGDVDHIRFRIVETRTSLMLYEYVLKKDIEFTNSPTLVNITLDIEKYDANTFFAYGIITNTSQKQLNKLLLELPFEHAEVLKIAGINKKESESELILYTDLWREPLLPGQSKQFILEVAYEDGFILPEKASINNKEVVLDLKGDTMLIDELSPAFVHVTVLSEWEEGCIVEFEVVHDDPEHLTAEIGHHFTEIDHWGADDIHHHERHVTFKGIDNQIGFIANKKNKSFELPKKMMVNNEEVPVKEKNSHLKKQSDYKPVVRNAVLAFDLQKDGYTTVSIIDKNGEVVETLFDDNANAGFYTFRWEPSSPQEVVYFYKLETNGSALTGQIIH